MHLAVFKSSPILSSTSCLTSDSTQIHAAGILQDAHSLTLKASTPSVCEAKSPPLSTKDTPCSTQDSKVTCQAPATPSLTGLNRMSFYGEEEVI